MEVWGGSFELWESFTNNFKSIGNLSVYVQLQGLQNAQLYKYKL